MRVPIVERATARQSPAHTKRTDDRPATARSRQFVKAQTTRRRDAVPFTAGRVRTAEWRAERFVCSGRRPTVAPAHLVGDR